jgi:hypothetical protein
MRTKKVLHMAAADIGHGTHLGRVVDEVGGQRSQR